MLCKMVWGWLEETLFCEDSESGVRLPLISVVGAQGQNVMHSGLASRGPPGGLLGASWRPLGAQGGPRTAQDAKKAKHIDFVTFKMAPRGPLGVQFWQFLDRFGVNFGTIFRSILKQCWGPFGVQFGGTPCGPPGGPHTSRILPRSWRWVDGGGVGGGEVVVFRYTPHQVRDPISLPHWESTSTCPVFAICWAVFGPFDPFGGQIRNPRKKNYTTRTNNHRNRS